MERLKIIIGASKDYFAAYAENCPGVYGAGETAEAAKENALEGLKLFVTSRPKEELPEILQGEYEIEYKYDTQSLLNYYTKYINCASLERLTGINQKLLHHYASGLKKPRTSQRKKIESSLHRLGNELLSVRL
jgi:predicted RNase H-like HicB family nuclease